MARHTSCFDNRIRRGAIFNLEFKDPHLFKVNVVFSANCIKPNGDNGNVQSDLKHFTRNNIIDLYTNLRKWYEEHVIDKILSKLEEFLERVRLVFI